MTVNPEKSTAVVVATVLVQLYIISYKELQACTDRADACIDKS